MKNINEFFIIGRQTRDITDQEFKYLSTGTPLLTLSIAVNESRKEGDEWHDVANFFDVTVWGKQAETLSRLVNKGKLLAIRGRLQQQRWTDNATGQTRSKVALIADEIELLSPRDNNNGGQAATQSPNYVQSQAVQYYNGQSQQAPQQQQQYAPQYTQQQQQQRYAPQPQQVQQTPQQVQQVQQQFNGQVQPGETYDPNEPPF